ncbi:cobalt-precorrin-5B (C(1))-methyltransferase CbiD [Oscillospiraceae bacterium PP1C4]
MGFDQYVFSGGKRLRCGYTTGSCAAAAAKAAAVMLVTGDMVSSVEIDTPKGIQLHLDVEDIHISADSASCAVRKDAGDDIDATNGILIYATVMHSDCADIAVDGGEGVGRITRKGLEQPVGAPAINRVPRLMIAREVRGALEERGWRGGVCVTISVPKGRETAAKTYNPRLGIEGGISILGTTGIVEPMSEAALIDTIRVELDMLNAAGARPILITPGNYGEVFAREKMGLNLSRSVLCSNFAGDTLDYAAQLGFDGLLLIGHIGKLVKLAGGIFNTHSHVADARMEILAAHAALAGANQTLVAEIMQCVTTDEVLDLLDEAGILTRTIGSVMEKIGFHIKHRVGDLPAEVVLFSNPRGVLGQTNGADALIQQFRHTEEFQ